MVNEIYMNVAVYQDDINFFCFYVNPKSNDIIQIRHGYFIGNVEAMNVFTHDVNKDYFKDKPNLINEILRVGTPKLDTDTVNVSVNPGLR